MIAALRDAASRADDALICSFSDASDRIMLARVMTGDASSEGSEFDESRWPIVIVTTPRQIMNTETFDEHCRKTFAYYDRGQDFALVFDVRNSPPLPAAQRRIVAEHLDRRHAQHPNVRLVTAIVVSSAVQRGVVKAILWLTRQPVPTEVVATIGEAVTWCQKALAAGPPAKRAAPLL